MTIIIILITSVASGIAMLFLNKPMSIGFAIGIAIGVSLAISIVRKLGRKSQKSLLASEIFHNITGYKARVFNISLPQPQTSAKATIYGKGHDYADLIDILKRQLKFPSDISKSAAQHAMDTAREDPLEEKIRVALQYIGSNGNQ